MWKIFENFHYFSSLRSAPPSGYGSMEPMGIPSQLIMYFDGGCEPKNPGGVATFGWCAMTIDNDIIAKNNGVVHPYGHPMSTNNVAEYTALLKGLEYLRETKWSGELLVRGDSMLVIRAIEGRWRCKAPHLIPIYKMCMDILRTFDRYAAEWIPRKDNSFCDELSSKAYKESRKVKRRDS